MDAALNRWPPEAVAAGVADVPGADFHNVRARDHTLRPSFVTLDATRIDGTRGCGCWVVYRGGRGRRRQPAKALAPGTLLEETGRTFLITPDA